MASDGIELLPHANREMEAYNTEFNSNAGVANIEDFASEETIQHLKDFKLAIEFKYLMKHAPCGVYLMPELDNIRKLHGVIFLRRGLYRDGVFRFQMNLPLAYNDVNTHPEIIFTPPVFSPLIDPETGVLDIRLEETLKEWSPDKHFCVTALLFLKKIFYMKSFEESAYPNVPNEEARRLFESDKDAYVAKVTQTVQDSLNRVYEEPSPQCTIRFSQPLPAHEVLKQAILRASADVSESPVVTGCPREGALMGVKNELEISMCDDTIAASGATTGEMGDAVGQQVPKKLPFYDGINEANDQ